MVYEEQVNTSLTQYTDSRILSSLKYPMTYPIEQSA